MERQNDRFFTIWYGVHSKSAATLSYSTGGHPPAIHLRAAADGKARASQLVTYGGMAIGAFPDLTYESKSIVVEPGDRLLVLSDGTFEVNGADGGMLSVRDLAEYAVAHSDEPGQILEWVRSINGTGPLPDDFSLLRIQF